MSSSPSWTITADKLHELISRTIATHLTTTPYEFHRTPEFFADHIVFAMATPNRDPTTLSLSLKFLARMESAELADAHVVRRAVAELIAPHLNQGAADSNSIPVAKQPSQSLPPLVPTPASLSDLEPDFSAARPGNLIDPLLATRGNARGALPSFGGVGDDGMLVGPNSFGPAARDRRPPGLVPGARFDPIGPQFGGGPGIGGIGGGGGGLHRPQQQQRRRFPPGERPPGFDDDHQMNPNPYDEMFM